MSLEKQINKSLSANSIFHKTSFSQGAESFLRISPVKVPNTEGQCPVVIFKKQQKIPSFYDIGLKDSGYITDGGLKQKLQKFEGVISIGHPHHKLLSTSLKQKSTLSNFSSGMNKRHYYSQSMRNINPKKSQDMKLHSKPSGKLKTSNVIECNPSTSQKLNNNSSSKLLTTKQRQCLSPEMKYEQIEGLIGKGIASKIKDYQNERVKKTREDEMNEKKQRYLEGRGISIELEDSVNDEEEDEDRGREIKTDEELVIEKSKVIEYDNLDVAAENQIEPKKMAKTNRTFSNSIFCASSHKEWTSEVNNMKNNQKNDSKATRILKPKIDHFEYLNHINNEMKIRSKELRTSGSQSHRNSNKEQNSFRKSHSSNHDLQSNHSKLNSNNQIIQINSKKKQVYDNDHNFLFSYQSNHRSEEELAHFIISKRIQEQEKEQKENLENNQRTFLIFRNLYILSQRLQPKPKASKQKRVKNEFYIGTQTNSNLSTVIDPNDYYYSVLEGQKLIVKTHFDSEQDQLDKSTIQRKPSQSLRKDDINRITKQKAEEAQNGSNDNMSSIKFSELKSKVSQTILRANKLLSQDNLDQLFESKHSRRDSNENENQKQLQEDERGNKIDINKKDKVTNTHSTQHVVSIENTSSYNGTKNLPSLSHTYTNNNTSPNKKKMIEPRAILNVVEIIKILTQRKVFYMLYEDYFNEKMIQRYTIAFVYFNAILKQRTFHSIEAFAHYKTYYYACSQLFLPFKRKQFEYFVSNCYFKKKVQYLIELLNHIIKKKVLERIFLYGSLNGEDEEIAFYRIFMKIMLITMRPRLQEAFHVFIGKARNADLNTSNKKSKKSSIDYEERKITVSDANESEMGEMDMYEKKAFTYDSCSEKSEITLEPNSLDSDKLHRVIMMNLKQKELMINLGYSNEEIEANDNLVYVKHHKRRRRKSNSVKSKHSVSNKSIKSLKDICKMEPGIKANKSIEELHKSLSNKSLQESLDEKLHHLKRSPSRNSSLNKSKEKDSPLNTSKDGKQFEEEKQQSIEDGNKENKWNSNKLKEDLAQTSSDRKRSQEEKEVICLPEDKQVKEKKIQIEVNAEEREMIEKAENEAIKKKEALNQITSEQDVSADKDCKDNIDWEINLSNSKSLINEKKDSESNTTPNHSNNKIVLKEASSEVIIKEVIEEKREESKTIAEEKVMQKEEVVIEPIPSKDTSQQSPKPKEELILNKEEILPSPIKKVTEKQDKVISLPKLTDSYCNEFEEGNLKDLEENINNTEENIVSLIQNEANQIAKDLLIQSPQLSETELERITSEILIDIIQSEIKDSETKIIPYKTFKMPFIPVNISDSLPPHSLDNPSNSFILNSANISHFSKTIKDKKKEQSFNLYREKVFPRLLDHIKKEITDNYPKIYRNLKTPIKSNPIGLMTSLALEDAEMLRENYKRLPLKPNELELLNKEKILGEYSVINKKIRAKDNVICDDYYDNMLNGCVVETAIELLQKERQYCDLGEPLPWSVRNRELNYKYPKDDPKKLTHYIEEQLTQIMNHKIGLITDNYDHVDSDQLNMEREKRLMRNITNELYESDTQWINLEMEDTQTKIEVNKLLLDQLYNEVIEILEHIQYSRKCPELYQNKSIYACEEIPKLTFQMTSSENEDDEENELINI